MSKTSSKTTKQKSPGKQKLMHPEPETLRPPIGAARLEGKVALISGADSGIGRAVAAAFAWEGADIAAIYLSEDEDAKDMQRMVEKEGRACILIRGDVGDPEFCKRAVEKTIKKFGRLDILVNNAGEQHPQDKIEDISPAQLERTFRTNIFAFFYLVQAAMPHLLSGSCIINTTSVTAYKGSPQLLDYSSTKGAIVSFTRSLALNLAKKNIRVNAVAPGPVWTPLIESTFPREQLKTFGKDTPLGRPGQPAEVAPCFVFLASDDASYISGQVLHPNGGSVVNG